MTTRGIIGQLMTALRKIAETDKPLEATCQQDWRRRARLIANSSIEQAECMLRKKYVRYCYECGYMGEVPKASRDCCPDGMHAVYVPQEVAEQARVGFNAQLVEIADRDITHA